MGLNASTDQMVMTVNVQKALPECSVRKTSMTVCQSRAITACVKTALPPSPVSVTLDILAPSATSRYRSATVTPARTEDAASTWSMLTSATVPLAPQELIVKLMKTIVPVILVSLESAMTASMSTRVSALRDTQVLNAMWR